MVTKLLGSFLVLGLCGFAASSGQLAPAGASNYAWAGACKRCHEPVYKAWANTKHATALARLGDDDRKQGCVGCHVTGPKSMVMDGSKVVNEGVQCEACHGAALAHVADPSNVVGLARTPSADICEACHSTRSPHFKGFFYSAMAGLVHQEH
jgi:cytochrome c554/c'-like protein